MHFSFIIIHSLHFLHHDQILIAIPYKGKNIYNSSQEIDKQSVFHINKNRKYRDKSLIRFRISAAPDQIFQ